MKKIFPFLLLWSNLSIAQTTIDNLLSPAFPTDLKSSADGNTLAWVFNNKGSRNIFVADGNGNNVKQITGYSGDDGIEINSIQFTPDGRQLIFVRGNGNNNQGIPANPAQLQTGTERNIYLINTDGKGLRKLGPGFYPKISPDGKTLAYLNGGQVWSLPLADTTMKPVQLFKARGNQSLIRWSPNGNKIAFTSNRGGYTLVGIFDRVTQLLTFPDPAADYDSDAVWSADGNMLAYIRIPNMRLESPFVPYRTGHPWTIRLLNMQTGKATEIWRADTGRGSVFVNDLPVADNRLLWAADDQLIFPWEKNGWIQLYALDITKKTIRHLTPGDGEVENMVLSPNGQSVYYTSNSTDINRRHIWKVSIATAKAELLTKGNNIEWNPVPVAAGIALLRASAIKPAWPALYQNGAVTDIGWSFFPKNYTDKLVQPQQISIKATDGMDIPAQLFLPANYKPGNQYPAVIFLHGGSRRQMLLGFNYGLYYSNAYALNQYFALNEYIVMALNYRSGIGYGWEFREALNYGITGASEVRDLFGAGEYLRNRKDVDAKKIGLWGGSYGGYLTAHGLAQRSDLFAAGVDIHGVHNWNDELPTFAPWYDSAHYPAIGKRAYESSPLYFINGWKNPVLLVHGDDDRNVPFAETRHLLEALRRRNVYVEQLVLPDEVHSFLRYGSWVKTYEAAFEFLEREMNRK
jgi:dipeptidyl aminopeptidase/acylaminoacyl peptidase